MDSTDARGIECSNEDAMNATIQQAALEQLSQSCIAKILSRSTLPNCRPEDLLDELARFMERSGLGSVWVGRLVMRTRNRWDAQFVEDYYPLNRSVDTLVGKTFGESNSDHSLIHIKVPFSSSSGFRVHDSDVCLIVLPCTKCHKEEALGLLRRVLPFVSSTSYYLVKEVANHQSRQISTSSNYLRRGADNILVYDLMKACDKVFRGRSVSASLWRTSRTERSVEQMARQPDWLEKRVDAFGIRQTIPILDFNAVFPPRASRPAVTRESVADCVFVTTDSNCAQHLKYVCRSLSNAQTCNSRRLPSVERFLFSSAENADGTIGFAHFPNNRRPLNRKAFLHVASRLLASESLGANQVAVIVPFFTAKETTKVKLKQLLKSAERSLSDSTRLPFFGCLVIVVPISELTSNRIIFIKTLLSNLSYLLDAYSHQRLRLKTFSKALEMLEKSLSIESIFRSCEFAAQHFFRSEGILVWTEPAMGDLPVYLSRNLQASALRHEEVQPFESGTENFTFLSFRDINDVPQFIRTALTKAFDRRARQLNEGRKTAAGASVFVVKLRLSGTPYSMLFLRDRPGKITSMEYSALSSLHAFLKDKVFHPSHVMADELSAAVKRLSYLDAHALKEVSKVDVIQLWLDQIEKINGYVGFIAFSFDNASKLLCFEGGEHYLKKQLSEGRDIRADGSTLASLAALEAKTLVGVKLEKEIDVYSAATGDSHSRVPFLGWLKESTGFLAHVIEADSHQKLVIVIGVKSNSVDLLRRIANNQLAKICQGVAKDLSFARAVERVRLRDRVISAERKLAEYDVEINEDVPDSQMLPPELTHAFPSRFCELMSQLLGAYREHFGWLSISLRVADWRGEELCRIAGTGPIGFQPRHKIDERKSTIGYCFRNCAPDDCISIPSLDDLPLIKHIHPNLQYRESRPGTASELCFPVTDSERRVIGTLNFESIKPRDFVSNRWACVRIHEDVQHSLRLQLTRQKAQQLDLLHGLKSYLSFIHHEVKNLADPLVKAFAELLPTDRLGSDTKDALNSVIVAQKRHFQKKVSVLSFAKDEMVYFHERVSKTCSTIIANFQQQLQPPAMDIKHTTIGEEAAVVLNAAILEMCLDTLLRDIHYRHQQDGGKIPLIHVVSSIDAHGFSIHIGQPARLEKALTERLFWFKNPTRRDVVGINTAMNGYNNGVGAYYLGLFLRSIGLYPKADDSLPPELVDSGLADSRIYRCWFSVYGRIKSL